MESLSRSLNFELSADTFDSYAQQMLQGPHEASAATPHLLLNGPSLSTAMPELSAVTVSSASSEFLKKLGASLINSIQLQQLRNQLNANPSSTTSHHQSVANMDLDLAAHHVSIDSSSLDGSLSEYQKQLEYDKFMNEIWIGIVLTLILISMVFCICSCFLYHQFKTWKRNYRSTIVQSQTLDIEAVKLHPDFEDPVPEYTLVSGLPTYEAALELLNKTAPNSCALIVYPSVFNVFNGEEQQQHQQQHIATESTTPLLSLRPGAAVRLNSSNGSSHSTHTSAVIECGENEYHLRASQPATPTASPLTPAVASQPTAPPSYISVTVNEKKAKSCGGSFKKPKSGKC